MGERLNLELRTRIDNDDVCLANAYYHWSGYTTSSLRLAITVIDFLKDVDFRKYLNRKNDIKYIAMKALELTGARVTGNDIEESEVEKVLSIYNTLSEKLKKFINIEDEELSFRIIFKDEKDKTYNPSPPDRNRGLLAISDSGMKTNENFSDHSLILYLDREVAFIGTIYSDTIDSLTENEINIKVTENEIDIKENEIYTLKNNYSFYKGIPFDSVPDLFEEICNGLEEGKYFFRNPTDDLELYSIVE